MSSRFEGNFSRIDHAIKQAVNPIALQVAKDSNRYVKKDTGATEGSVWSASDFSNGKVIWDTEYAVHAYYLNGALKDKNPLATTQWFLTGKANHMQEWLKVAQNAVKEAL